MPNPNKDMKGLKSNEMLNGITDSHSDVMKKHMLDVELKDIKTASIKLDEMIRKIEMNSTPVFSETDLKKLASFFKEEDDVAVEDADTTVVSTVPQQKQVPVEPTKPAPSVVSIELPADVDAGDTGEDVDLNIEINLNALMGEDDAAEDEMVTDNAPELAEQLKIATRVIEGLLKECSFAEAADKVSKVLSNTTAKSSVIRNVVLDRLLEEFDGMIEDENKTVEEEIEEAKVDVAGPLPEVEAGKSVLQVTLPTSINPSDVKVNVMDASEGGTATVQISLPSPVAADEIDVTLSKPSDVPIDGAKEETPAKAKKPAEENPEGVEELEGAEELEEEEPEGEETMEEAVELNKKLLPIAENHKGVNTRIGAILTEAATGENTSFDVALLKETHLFWKNGGKKPEDFMYPIVDRVNGKLMVAPDSIKRMAEMFNNNVLISKFNKHTVRVVRKRLEAYLEAMGLDVPWKKTGNLVITENANFLRITQGRDNFDPYKVFQKLYENSKK